MANSKSKKSGKQKDGQLSIELKKMSPRTKRRIFDLLLVLVTGFSILCFVACFVDTLKWLDDFCYLLFGVLRYATPFIIITVAFLLRFVEKNWSFLRRAIAGIIIFFAISGITCLIDKDHLNAPVWGGLLGRWNILLLLTTFGVIGSYIINIVLILIGVVLFSDFSFIDYLGDKLHKESEIHNKKSQIRHEEHQQVREERHKKRLEEVELSASERRKQENEKRFQPIKGIGDTTISEGAPTINTNFNDSSSATAQNAKLFKDNVADDNQLVNEKTVSFLKKDAAKPVEQMDFTPEIRIPSDFFKGEFEDSEHIDNNSVNPFKEPESFKKTIVTSNGKTMEVETDGDVLAKKQIYNGDGEPISSGASASGIKKAEPTTETLVVEKPSTPPIKEYRFPPMRLLHKGSGAGAAKDQIQQEIKFTADRLQQTLKTFGVNVTITHVSYGPSVTRYELQPELGVKVSKILSLTDDIKLSLAAADVRIEAPIPGKSAIGIEVPNKVKTGVVLHDLLDSPEFSNAKSSLAFGLGKDIEGNTIISDIEKMPHVLVAGTTGSGKSVCINAMIMSILYHAKPTEVKMILVDPKVVEFAVYNGIPHLLLPVVTDPKKAASALNWAVAEMERRYDRFAEFGVRGIEGFNTLVDTDQIEDSEGNPLEKMPQIVIIIDELADLMMVAANEVETAICRLAQKARAAGMHLVLATQRPSVDVITGLIKANIPSRIALSVSSGVDSRTILDMNGAEKLLGHGDMLFDPQGATKPLRVQGAYVSDAEIGEVVNYVLSQGPVKGMTVGNTIDLNQTSSGSAGGSSDDSRDEYFVESAYLIIEKQKASIGMLQRAFKLGFNRAARIMDQLCEAGVVGEEEGTKPRRILMNAAQFEEFLNQK